MFVFFSREKGLVMKRERDSVHSFVHSFVHETILYALPDYEMLKTKLALHEQHVTKSSVNNSFHCDMCLVPFDNNCETLTICGKRHDGDDPCENVVSCGRPWCKTQPDVRCKRCGELFCHNPARFLDESRLCDICDDVVCATCRASRRQYGGTCGLYMCPTHVVHRTNPFLGTASGCPACAVSWVALEELAEARHRDEAHGDDKKTETGMCVQCYEIKVPDGWDEMRVAEHAKIKKVR